MTDATTSPDATDALVERLFGATLGGLELLSVYLGWRLDLYRSLAESGPATVKDFAAATDVDARYAQEWLEQQASAGFLDVDLDGEPTFSLPDAHQAVLVDPESLAHVAPFAAMLVGIAAAVPEVVEAYRTGAGVPYPRYGAEFRDGQGAINRPAYHHEMASWVASMPDVDARLRAGGRIVDLGCGQGWSTIALARTYPSAEVIGVDSDVASIADATRNVEAAGVTVRLVTDDAAADAGTADLVCIFEALHDMAQPVAVLSAARSKLAAGGALLLVDERVEDEFTGAGEEVERMMYAWSVLHCLPASRAESPSAALGTVLRRPTVRTLAAEAGFSTVTELEIENDFFRFYRLDP